MVDSSPVLSDPRVSSVEEFDGASRPLPETGRPSQIRGRFDPLDPPRRILFLDGHYGTRSSVPHDPSGRTTALGETIAPEIRSRSIEPSNITNILKVYIFGSIAGRSRRVAGG